MYLIGFTTALIKECQYLALIPLEPCGRPFRFSSICRRYTSNFEPVFETKLTGSPDAGSRDSCL